MSFDQSTVSRRTVAKGAAWSVPAVAVAAAAPSLAASSLEYQSVTKSFVYHALGTIDIGVEVTANNVPLDVHQGEPLMPIEVTSTVTIPENLVGIIQASFLGGGSHLKGTSESSSTLDGAYSGTTTSDLTIGITEIPASGPLVFSAVGAGQPLTITGASAGEVTITMGEPVSVLLGCDAEGNENGSEYNSELTKDPALDYTLATFTIH